jgi:hypothetical protein
MPGDARIDPEAMRSDSEASSGSPDDTGASAPEASLVAREARASIGDPGIGDLGAVTTPGPDEDPGLRLEEGSARAPRSGRVDAAGATLGPEAGEHGSFAAGEGISSVGGAQGDTPGSGVADQPTGPGDRPQDRAGFLEGEGGRRGTEASEGEIYDDMGGSVRSIGDAARDTADEASSTD